MRSIVFAYHDVGCEAIRALHEMGEEIGAVFTHREDKAENVWFGSVEKTARELQIPVFTPENPNAEEWVEKIRALKPEIIYSFYYRRMISEELLKIPPKGALNLHGSLLPKFRGRAPVNWVLIKGEKETGLTLHYMVAKPDAGDIVMQKKVAITPEDTALTLFKKLIPLVRPLLAETVPLLKNGTAPKIPQDSGRATYFGGRKPADGKIDWTAPAEDIYNLIRAVTHPYPGAFSFFKGKKFFIWKAAWFKENTGKAHEPGTVISLKRFLVQCGNGILDIESAQNESEMEMNGNEWAKSNSVQIGSLLGNNIKSCRSME